MHSRIVYLGTINLSRVYYSINHTLHPNKIWDTLCGQLLSISNEKQLFNLALSRENNAATATATALFWYW